MYKATNSIDLIIPVSIVLLYMHTCGVEHSYSCISCLLRLLIYPSVC